jgi:exodeoxyribonuclease V alpha subunit
VVRRDPYRLAQEVRGIGFATADAIARDGGIDPQDPRRIQAGVIHLLRELAGSGHLCYPVEMLGEKAVQLLEADGDLVRRAVETLAHKGTVILESMTTETSPGLAVRHQVAYLSGYHRCEVGIARRLTELQRAPGVLARVTPEAILAAARRALRLEPAPEQERALTAAFRSKVLVITGGPGTGKTTILRGIVHAARGRGYRCALAAPTGRASRRMTEATGVPAQTIHRLLEFQPVEGGFLRDAESRLECDLLAVDEASMIDAVLLYHLLQALPDGASLVLIGDADQLPPVGPGNTLRDIVAAGTVPVVALRHVHRQARQSRIVLAAHRILNGRHPVRPRSGEPSDFYFVHKENPEAVLQEVISLATSRIPDRFDLDPRTDVQVLAPMRRGLLGIDNLNAELQAVQNPETAGRRDRLREVRSHPPSYGRADHAPEATWGGPGDDRAAPAIRAGDKVMQQRNNYDKDVFNGDVGRVVDADRQRLVVDFDGRAVTYKPSERDQLTLAYAVTVHKSQGSEYPAVVIPIVMQHRIMLRRNLIYTAVTRGRRLVVMVGSPRALTLALKDSSVEQRYTYLRNRLEAAR